MDSEKAQGLGEPGDGPTVESHDAELINISGHKQELDRIFDPLSIISTAIATGNAWVALAGTIVGPVDSTPGLF